MSERAAQKIVHGQSVQFTAVTALLYSILFYSIYSILFYLFYSILFTLFYSIIFYLFYLFFSIVFYLVYSILYILSYSIYSILFYLFYSISYILFYLFYSILLYSIYCIIFYVFYSILYILFYSILYMLFYSILFNSKCQFHLPLLNSARYGHSTQISSTLCVLTVTQRKRYLLIWYHSSGSPASWRAALNAFLSANRITQLIHNGGSPVAGTEVRTFWIS
jgi:hypothetical protein